ncbi:sulfatase-like hydrolase/transferase [bacterium]|nr:sulfatase-like hydrolase/transferase [bacterium]
MIHSLTTITAEGRWSRLHRLFNAMTIRACLFAAAVIPQLIDIRTTLADQTAVPNIILVMADDQGYGDTGFTGHPTLKTPHMDAMAAKSVVFNRFYAGAPVCSPTRASVMTGRTPTRVNVPNHGHYLRPHEITIAEALKTAGYSTGHFGKWHIGSVQPNSPTSPGGQGFDEWVSGLNFFDRNPYLSRNGNYERMKGQGSVIAMDETIQFIKKHTNDAKPFFAVTWFPAPHDPHRESLSEVDQLKLYSGPNQGYYREIQLIDQQLGRLRKTLRTLKIAKNTILWYCSDNGGLVKEYSGGRAKKGSIYEGGLRIPSMIEWPAKFKASKINTPAYTCDMYPTLVRIAGAKVEHQPQLDGIDLEKIIAGEQTRRPPMGFWHFLTAGQSTKSDEIIKSLMEAKNAGKPNPFPNRILKNVNDFPKREKGMFTGHAAWNDFPWKLHRIQKKEQSSFELYNLESDPMETNDLLKLESERGKKMRAELEAWQASIFDSLEGKDYKDK